MLVARLSIERRSLTSERLPGSPSLKGASARALDAFFEHWMEETRQDQSMRRVLRLAFAWGAFYQQNLAPKPE
jgi:hypothetical protein